MENCTSKKKIGIKKIDNSIYDIYIFSFYNSNLFQEKIYV